MAVVISGDEATSRLSNIISGLRSLRTQRKKIDRQAQDMEAEGNTGAAIQTAINALLTDWGSLRDQLVTELSAIPVIHQSRVKVGMPARHNYAVVEANNQSNTNDFGTACGVIRTSPAAETDISPFSVFLAGDVVSVSNAENSDNNISATVQWTPETAGAEVIQNGRFNNATPATYWTETNDGGSEITITSGVCTFATATAILSQAKADMVGGGWTTAHRYLVTFTLGSASAGTLAVGTNTSPAQHTVTAATTHKAIILADNNAAGLKFTATGFTGTLTYVSVIPFTGVALDDELGTDNSADTSLVITLKER